MTSMSTFSDEKQLQIETFGDWLCLHILGLHRLGTSIIYPGTKYRVRRCLDPKT